MLYFALYSGGDTSV